MRIRSLIYLAIVVLAMVVIPVSPTKNLIFVQELFRHGARYPIYAHRNLDMTDYVFEEHSNGQLTTQGKNMHYLLGKQIYKQYWNALFAGTVYNNQYNQSKFFIKSTDVNRTIQSCQSHLMGIFDSLPALAIDTNQANFAKPLWPGVEATAGDVFPTARQFHPLPIHVEKLGTTYDNKGDFLRSYSPENCPMQDQWKTQNQQTKLVKQIYSHPRFAAALKELSRVLKMDVSFEESVKFYDNFETTMYLGRPTLDIFKDPNYARDLTYMYVMDLYINLYYSHNPIQVRTTSSGFFEATLANIDNAIKKRDIQWVIYSAHDTTVGNMLAAMNMTNVDCIYEAYLKGDKINKDTCIVDYPGYTASIIFEVWQDNQTTIRTFKVRYLGEVRKIPFCDYQQECPLQRLKQWYESSIKVQSFTANCGLYNTDKQFYQAFAIIQLGVIISFVIFLLLKSLKRPKAVVKQESAPGHSDGLNQKMMKEEIETD